jgi:hypothetical protein
MAEGLRLTYDVRFIARRYIGKGARYLWERPGWGDAGARQDLACFRTAEGAGGLSRLL